MATFNLALNYGYTLRLVVNQGTQSIPNNTTVASYEFAIHQGSSWWGEYHLDGISWSVRSPANNAFTSGTRTPGYDFRNASKVVIKSGTRTVSHASNGTYSVRWEGHWAGQHTRLGGGSVGGTVTFSTIPRASSFTSPGTVTTGNSATISISRHSSSFTHDVAYRIGSGSWTNIATGVGTSTTWTPPHTLFNNHPTSASLSGTFRVITKSGSTQIGSAATRSFTLNLNSSQTPTVNSVVWHDQNPLTNNMGAIIQNKSILKGTVDATGVVGSTISRRELIVQGNTFLDSTLINPGSVGNITASGRAVDSRGRSATAAANFTVLPYNEPNIVNFQVNRSDAGGTIAPDGDRVRVDLNVAASSIVVSGEEKNALTIKVMSKNLGAPGSQWVTRHTINTGVTYDDWFVIPSATFSVNESYDIGVVVVDNLHTGPETPVIRPISTEAVTMHWKGNSVGIGKRHELGTLDVGGDIYANGLKANTYYLENVDASQPPSDFKVGTTFGQVGSGFPTPFGVVETSYYNDDRAVQTVHEKDGDNRVWFRTAAGNTWLDWRRILASDPTAIVAETRSLHIQPDGTAEPSVRLLRNYNGLDRHVHLYSTANSNNAEWGIIAGEDGTNMSRLYMNSLGQLQTQTYAGSPTATGTRPVPFAFAAGHLNISTTFPTVSMPGGNRFTATPRVVAQLISGSGSDMQTNIMVTNVTTTQFQARHTGSSGTRPMDWIAIQMRHDNGSG